MECSSHLAVYQATASAVVFEAHYEFSAARFSGLPPIGFSPSESREGR